ncbi:hypothetical protein A9308_05460 [Moraxella atlantae]|uniref:Uncharacterized protein n=1 Tax=Faucicola atlantae TaxID=34059 RepID=A0A1B8QDP6_9GAMM|nr:hypothetical protein A9308_05460 [Moraxella atlantae]
MVFVKYRYHNYFKKIFNFKIFGEKFAKYTSVFDWLGEHSTSPSQNSQQTSTFAPVCCNHFLVTVAHDQTKFGAKLSLDLDNGITLLNFAPFLKQIILFCVGKI